jgi:hypothetical protein
MKNIEKAVITGFSLRRELLDRLETQRGDISRSKFLQRLLERALESDKQGVPNKK